jgi:GPI mannosyltransferase 3
MHALMDVINTKSFRLKTTFDEHFTARLILAAALLIGLIVRIAIIFTDEGIYWPDEIYQSFEPAHHLVFGYGLLPWEFIQGARNWALPGFVAAVLKLCALSGFDSPLVYVRVTKIVFALASLGTAIGIFRLSKAYGAKDAAASFGASIFALCGLCLYFSHRAMSENATALPVIWGLAFVLEKSPGRRRQIVGASLLGLAALFRIQSAIFCAGCLGILLARRQLKQTGIVFLVFAFWAFVYGALDALTWHNVPGTLAGGWFHSAVVYIRFNLIEGRASDWGTSPWFYYFRYLWSAMPSVAIVFSAGVLLAWRRAAGIFAIAAVFFALYSLVPHKEMRFLIPVLPLLCALTGVGLSSIPNKVVRNAAMTGAMLALLFSTLTFRTLTFGSIGAYLDRANESAWDDCGDKNRLLLEASKQKDLCGIRLDANLAWTGGSTYLHRKAPLYAFDSNKPQEYFNYAIVV